MTDEAELEVLDVDECIDLLRGRRLGRVAVTVADSLHIVPVAYVADGDGVVVFRTGPHTVLTAVSLSNVAFEVDELDDAQMAGWSVCVHGYGTEITGALDPASQRLRQLPVTTTAPGPRPRWFAIRPREVTGRRLRLPPLAAIDDDIFAGIPWS